MFHFLETQYKGRKKLDPVERVLFQILRSSIVTAQMRVIGYARWKARKDHHARSVFSEASSSKSPPIQESESIVQKGNNKSSVKQTRSLSGTRSESIQLKASPPEKFTGILLRIIFKNTIFMYEAK